MSCQVLSESIENDLTGIVNMDEFFENIPPTHLFRSQMKLQLNSVELCCNNYPLPWIKGFIDLPPTCKREPTIPHMFALDCEMLTTRSPDGRLWKELARVSVVDHNLKVIFDVLVKPKYPVNDYVTQFSGLTAEIMADAKLSLQEVQDMFVEQFDATTIFVGHSLEQDLIALRIFHLNIIDTAVLHCRKYSCAHKPKLKFLCALHLNRLIQAGVGHDSVEDAKAAMILALYFLIEPHVFGKYHLPHGMEASMFFASCEQFYQVNIIPEKDNMLWLDSFVDRMTRLVNTASKQHPLLSFHLCPYWYFMPNFEVGDVGIWGGTFIIGIRKANPGVHKMPCKENEQPLVETLETEFAKVELELSLEYTLHMTATLLDQAELPIWIWCKPKCDSPGSSAQETSDAPEVEPKYTLAPSPTPSRSDYEVDSLYSLTATEIDFKPSSIPTSLPSVANTRLLEAIPTNKFGKECGGKKRKKYRGKRKRRNKKKSNARRQTSL